LVFKRADFQETNLDIFAVAANERLNEERFVKEKLVEISVKYQVLCKHTAMIGVVK